MPKGTTTGKKNPRRDRLEELLALAQTYRGWTLRELAAALGRDPHKLVPESGIPKLDLVIRLSEVLDWSVEDVARDLCGDDKTPVERSPSSSNFRQLDRQAFDAYGENRFEDMQKIAEQALQVAGNSEETCRGLMRLYVAYDAQGRFQQALDCAQRGLREVEAPLEYHLSFRANLANAHYTLGNLYEAEALSNSLVEWFAGNPLPSPVSQSTKAFAYYVRGSCHRVLAGTSLPNRQWHAGRAHEDLTLATQLLDQYAQQVGHETYAGYANVCRGGALEVAPLIGVKSPEEVIEQFLKALDDVITPDEMPRGAWLESWGWWCVYGCNLALRHVQDEDRLQMLMGIFTNKADEIAEHLGNWALRERVWTLELARRRISEGDACAKDWIMDDDDVRVVAGTMARFPIFREVGWQVLRFARRVGQ